MSKEMNLIFEPMDLSVASPATVSRCGMVYMEPASMGWRVLIDSWVAKIPGHFLYEDKILIAALIDWVSEHLLTFLRANVDEPSPTQDQNLLQSMMRLYSILLKDF